jgi:hypothetical protein
VAAATLVLGCAASPPKLDHGVIEGTAYVNHGLGLRVEPPVGWRFDEPRSRPSGTRVEALFGESLDLDSVAGRSELFRMSGRPSERPDRLDLSLALSASVVPRATNFQVEAFASTIEESFRKKGRIHGRAEPGPRRWQDVAGYRFLVVPVAISRERPCGHLDLYFHHEDGLLMILGVSYSEGEAEAADAAVRSIQSLTRLGEER